MNPKNPRNSRNSVFRNRQPVTCNSQPFNPNSKFQNEEDSINPMNSTNPRNSMNSLYSALTLDPSNATYHYELGHHYSELFNAGLKQGKWKLYRGKWFINFKKETIDYGLMTRDSFLQAIDLQPTKAWHHFYFGWTLDQLAELNAVNSRNSTNPMNSTDSVSPIRIPHSKFRIQKDPMPHFTLALTLDPTNPHIKDYVAKWQGKTLDK